MIKENTVTFSNGRNDYANRGIVGLNPDLETSYGYDGDFPSGRPLSKEERTELADYMISLWTKYKEVDPDKEEW